MKDIIKYITIGFIIVAIFMALLFCYFKLLEISIGFFLVPVFLIIFYILGRDFYKFIKKET